MHNKVLALASVALLAAYAGGCGKKCDSGQTLCSDACVDTNSDTSNCGSCGNACPSGNSCTNGACVAPHTYIRIAGHATDHPTTWPTSAPVFSAGAQIILVDPLKQIADPTHPSKAILALKTGTCAVPGFTGTAGCAVGVVGNDGSWSFADVDVTSISVGVVATIQDAPTATTPHYFPNGSGVVGAPSGGATWHDVTSASVFGLPLSQVVKLDRALSLTPGSATSLEKVGFLYGWVIDHANKTVNCASVSSTGGKTITYPDAVLSNAVSGSTNKTAWHGIFLVPNAGSPDSYSASAAKTGGGTDSFGPRVRSRVQWVSSEVGKLPSQIMPTCAPPSDRPGTVSRWVSIS